MNIFDRVSLALSILSVPVAANVWLGKGALPDDYITFAVISAPAEAHADNREVTRSYRIQVSLWSRSGIVALDVIGAMTAAGFMRAGMRTLQHDEQSRHFGLAYDFVYTEDVSNA